MRRQPDIKFRTSGTRAVPYIELPIHKDSSLIKRVVVGPSAHARQNFEAAARLSRSWGFEVLMPEHAFDEVAETVGPSDAPCSCRW